MGRIRRFIWIARLPNIPTSTGKIRRCLLHYSLWHRRTKTWQALTRSDLGEKKQKRKDSAFGLPFLRCLKRNASQGVKSGKKPALFEAGLHPRLARGAYGDRPRRLAPRWNVKRASRPEGHRQTGGSRGSRVANRSSPKSPIARHRPGPWNLLTPLLISSPLSFSISRSHTIALPPPRGGSAHECAGSVPSGRPARAGDRR